MAVHKVGIIGYGGFGRFLHNSWKTLKSAKVVAVADVVASNNPGGGIKFYNDPAELVNDDEVDIVSVATLPCSHAEMACLAMESNKHVLIEKPLGITVAGANQVLTTRDKTGKIATVNYMLRFNPIVEALTILTKERVFGQLRHVNVENYTADENLPAEHWFWDRQNSGGILVEHAVHFIDLVHSLTDQECRSVSGFCHNRNPQQEDQVFASVLYSEGLIANHYHSFARPGFFENTSIRLNFDLATVDIEGWIPLKGRLVALFNDQTKQRMSLLPNLQLENITPINSVKDDSRPQKPGGYLRKEATSKVVRSGGIEYAVAEQITGLFDIGLPKQRVYANCVRAMLTDMITEIERPDHVLRVTLEDGLSSLRIACLASDSGRQCHN